jgi:2-dehydropantoate 2-reductase
MKLTIFGAGAVGGHIAARLAKSGVEVHVIARGAHLQAIKDHGLILQVEAERIPCKVIATDDPSDLGPQDLVIVSVKGTGLAAAAVDIHPLIGTQTHVLFVMNGLPWWFADGTSMAAEMRHKLDPDEILQSLIPLSRSIWGVIRSGGAIIEPGVIQNTTPKRNALVLGYPDDSQDQTILNIREMINNAGYNTTISQNIRKDIWAKLLINSSTAMVSALTGRDNLQTVSNPETRSVAMACMREIIGIGRSIGIQVEADPVEVTDPLRTEPHRSSFLQDLDAGRPLELATTIIAVRDIARANGFDAPHLGTVAALITARASSF